MFNFLAEFETWNWLILLTIFLAALAAGWIDSIVGGGGLIQLPALLLVPGLTPVQALASNKFGSIFGTAVSTVTYARKIKLDFKTLVPITIVALVGSFFGAVLAAQLPAQAFLPIIILALVAVLLLTLLKPSNRSLEQHRWNPSREVVFLVGLLIGASIGFYDGLIGPGTGSFLIISLILLLQKSFLEASASAKLINFATNLGALIYFGFIGAIVWQYAIVAAIGNMLGGFFGAKTAMKHGSGFVKTVLVVIVSVLIVKLSWDYWQQLGI